MPLQYLKDNFCDKNPTRDCGEHADACGFTVPAGSPKVMYDGTDYSIGAAAMSLGSGTTMVSFGSKC